ncbi:MAG: lasso RiPP family leader peptide-containing protein [Deltaproteobacteria bacterium]|nr:lasso RiPP family leader peptide-containing protein [Deltaproteobacteria bacterium]MBW1818705.1 lasso RiPP family leader peptide-containing protein [Deltaproteobacteria bacterium]
MEKEKIQVKKHAYEKPALAKHGNLKDVTANGTVKRPPGSLGCTRF